MPLSEVAPLPRMLASVAMRLALGTPNLMQRLPRLPSAPDISLLRGNSLGCFPSLINTILQ